MGAGFAFYTPQSEIKRTIKVAEDHGFQAWHAGNVEAGPKRLIIEPRKIVFAGASLAVRK
jgi:phosphoribosylformylglycinamidine cyclo-ligase